MARLARQDGPMDATAVFAVRSSGIDTNDSSSPVSLRPRSSSRRSRPIHSGRTYSVANVTQKAIWAAHNNTTQPPARTRRGLLRLPARRRRRAGFDRGGRGRTIGLSVGTKKNVEQKNLALATGTSGAQSSRQRRCFHKKRTLRRRQTVWAITVRPDNSDWTPLCTARARAPRTTGLSRRERVIRIAIAEQHDRPKTVGSCCEDAPAAVASVLCSGERRMLTMHCPERARA